MSAEFRHLMEAVTLAEKLIIRDDAVSDVDGQAREIRVFLNPGRQEAEAVIRIRGFVQDHETGLVPVGSVVIWDAFLADHAGVETLLARHGYGEWWPRISVSADEFSRGVIRNYIDHGADESLWETLPKQHLERMLGTEPEFVPT